ncbi:MAG TPA: DUF885 domain-containing protein [Thermoanaerobaculia bacterium]|jgi:uncharacterized protein (DUF885 family)
MPNKLLAVALAVAFAASAAAATDTEKLRAMYEEEWQTRLRTSPEMASYYGDKRYDAQLSDLSAEAMERSREHARDMLRRLEAMDRSKIDPAERVNYDLLLLRARYAVEAVQFPDELMPITQMGGVYSSLAYLAEAMPRDDVKDYENFIARMGAFPRQVGQVIALMRRGVAAGITPPRAILGRVGELIGNQISDDPAKTPVFMAFDKFGDNIPPAEQERLRKEALTAVRTSVLPAMRKLRDYWVGEYYPHTRESTAMSELPRGREWYAMIVKTSTTTDLTPDQIHELGLSEVARIRREMETVKESTGYKGTLPEFFEFLRTDPQFFYKTREELLQGYRNIAKRIDPELVRLFGKLPRMPYGVMPIPEYQEKTATTAYYGGGSYEAHRPAYYFVNTYQPESRPKWEMEALTMHESVPGHHLQLSLADELENLPKFRQFGIFPAYNEGWGLYAESLGYDLGMYTDPYSKFGQLTYEMWRAIRLVVDTGLHTKGWTRQQAIDYCKQNSGRTQTVIEQEIDRYIAQPGGATVYKIGQLKILELRKRAQKELGEKFDIRAFHDAILGEGALPLAVLDAHINDWIAAQKKESGAKATITLRRE